MQLTELTPESRRLADGTLDLYDLDLDCVDDLRAHGAHVAREGGEKSECPVAPGHPHWSAWQLEWSETRAQMERISGAMGYRTRLMKAEVRRQMERLPEHQPDPTAEVAPERRRGGFIWHSMNPVSINITVNTSAIKAAMEDAARSFEEAVERVNRVFTSTGTELADLADLADLLGISTEPTEASLEQRRHGRAALCPRHGQTKGGTCMKCARRR